MVEYSSAFPSGGHHDFPPALRQRVQHLQLSPGQPAGRGGADHRSGAGEGRSLPAAGGRARPQAGQGGGHAHPRRPHHRARRAARPHALHHRDGRERQGRRGLHARHRGRQAHHRGPGARRALHAGPHRQFLQLPDARPRLHRRHAADPRHGPHRFPERQRAGAIRVAVRQAAEAAGGHAGVPRPRLQGRHGLHHRRGEALQPAPAGEIGRRVRRPDEQAQAGQSEDDGRGGAGQHAPGARPGRDRAEGLGRDAGAGAWRWWASRTWR